MIDLDENALTDRFWEIDFSYTDAAGDTVLLSDERKLVENQSAQVVDETQPWVRFTISPGESQIDATGTIPTYKQLGTAYLQVFAPKGTGMSAARELRDQMANAFRGWFSPDGCCHVYKVGFTTVDQSAYTQVNVAVSWESLRKPV